MKLDSGGVTRCAENSENNYAGYADFLLTWGVIKQEVKDPITSDLIGEINTFDSNQIAATAKSYQTK